MKCPYQSNQECVHIDTSGMTQINSCEECEYHDINDIRLSQGCLEPAISIGIVFGIILIIILLLL